MTDEFRADAPEMRISSFGPGTLAIGVDHPLAHPWASYRVPVEQGVNEQELDDAVRELAKLVTWFKGDTVGQLSHPKKTMDTIVAKERVNVALFEHAVQSGLIVHEEVREFLSPLLNGD